MKLWLYILVFGFGFLLAWLLLGKSSQTIIETKTVTDTLYQDTGTYHVKEVPVVKYIIKPSDTVYLTKVDSQEVVSDWFLVRGYGDTIVDDSSLFIAWSTKVTKNRLDTMIINYQNRTPTVINNITNTTIIDKQYQLWLGVGAAGTKTSFDLRPKIGWIHKHIQYGIEYGIMSKEIELSMMYGFGK
jgi:hypothetical protein